MFAGLLVAVAVPACGGSSSSPEPGTPGGASGAGSGGRSGSAGAAGKAGLSAPVTCGSKTCRDVVIAQADFTIPACCADAATSSCGLDSTVLAMFGPTFPEACQPLAQPGNKDATCPASPQSPVAGTALTIAFPGCCRPDNSCGFQLDSIGGLIPLGLGCVDSAPFVDGGTPQRCLPIGAK